MKQSMNGFALADIDHGGCLIIDVFAEIRAAVFHAGFDMKGRDFQTNFRAEEFNHAPALVEIKALSQKIAPAIGPR